MSDGFEYAFVDGPTIMMNTLLTSLRKQARQSLGMLPGHELTDAEMLEVKQLMVKIAADALHTTLQAPMLSMTGLRDFMQLVTLEHENEARARIAKRGDA